MGSNTNYVRIIGFTINAGPSDATVVAINAARALNMVTGNEIGYCKITQVAMPSYADNHQCILVQFDDSTWIHNCELLGSTDSVTQSTNSAGLKVYDTFNLLCEDNYIHGNTVGIFDKDATAGLDNDTYARNWITNNASLSFLASAILGQRRIRYMIT